MGKVRRIDAATEFGSYRAFTWDAGATEDFKRYNLLYGWNYSGKTTYVTHVRLFAPPTVTGRYERRAFSGYA